MDKQFCHLKQRQKEQISEWLYQEYRRLWLETGHEPHKRNDWKIAMAVMEHITAAEIWIPEHEISTYFSRRKNHLRKRMEKEFPPKQTDEE